ncbi:MAG TPA: PilN domain-containing protein [Oxalicibacterium sp.]|nr:PilN domain-containing protein [Oxalicibacterium sp.]
MSQQINLFNPIFLKQEKHFSALTMVQGLCIILLGALLLTAYSAFQLSKLEKEQAATASRLQQAQNQLARVTTAYAVKGKDAELDARLLRKQAEVQSLQQVTDLLAKGEFGNTVGYADYMTAFARQIGSGIWLTGFTIQGASDIAIRGNTLRPELVPAYLSRLKTEPVMQGASFSTLEMQLPKPDNKTAAAAADAKPKSAPPYIEFSLHSSGIKASPEGGRQ